MIICCVGCLISFNEFITDFFSIVSMVLHFKLIFLQCVTFYINVGVETLNVITSVSIAIIFIAVL